MGDLVAALVASGGLDAPRPVWIDEARLLAKNRYYVGLPQVGPLELKREFDPLV